MSDSQSNFSFGRKFFEMNLCPHVIVESRNIEFNYISIAEGGPRLLQAGWPQLCAARLHRHLHPVPPHLHHPGRSASFSHIYVHRHELFVAGLSTDAKHAEWLCIMLCVQSASAAITFATAASQVGFRRL